MAVPPLPQEPHRAREHVLLERPHRGRHREPCDECDALEHEKEGPVGNVSVYHASPPAPPSLASIGANRTTPPARPPRPRLRRGRRAHTSPHYPACACPP